MVGQSSESSKTGAALVVRPTSESASLVGSHPSCCQVQSRLMGAGDAGRRVAGLLDKPPARRPRACNLNSAGGPRVGQLPVSCPNPT